MNRFALWLALQLARALDTQERDALLGDHAELGVNAIQALRDTLGLVIRRQLEPWRQWRPWLALLGLTVPFSLFLSAQSLEIGRAFARGLLPAGPSPYSRYFDGFLLAAVATVVLTFGVWSWTSSYVISAFSRPAAGVNQRLAVLIWLAVVASVLFDPEFYQKLSYGGDELPRNLAAALVFHLLSFVIPAVFGFRAGSLGCRPSLASSIALLVVTVSFMTTLTLALFVPVAPLWVWGSIAFTALVSWPNIWILWMAYRRRSGGEANWS